jgi:hypothetical protein
MLPTIYCTENCYPVIHQVQARRKFAALSWQEGLKEGDKMEVIPLTDSFWLTINDYLDFFNAISVLHHRRRSP